MESEKKQKGLCYDHRSVRCNICSGSDIWRPPEEK